MPSGKPKAGESFGDLFPDVASEWHPTLNGELTPFDFSKASDMRAWWKCPKANDHEWQTMIKKRSKGTGCPFCAGQKVSVTNSLATLAPDIASQWHPTLNGELTPNDVVKGSDKRVMWMCPVGGDHQWEARISDRSKGRGCPYCAGKKLSKTNSLASLAPGVAKQWHPSLNGDLTPADVVAGSKKKVWWKCPEGPDHEWEANIGERATNRKRGCPFCAGQRVSVTNSLASLAPHLVKEWDYEKNGDLKPEDVVLKTNKKIAWKCPKGPDHEWIASGNNRDKGTNCPMCANKRVSVTNSLETLYPKVSKEWHPTKNNGVTPRDVIAGSNKRYWFKCDKGPDHEWEAIVNNRTTHGSDCPMCAGREVSVTNSIATQCSPEILKEWHFEKNGDVTPDKLPIGTHKNVWWKCDKGPDHEWQAQTRHRMGLVPSMSARGCPACNGKQVSVTNNLVTRYPLIASQWHPTKNKGVSPDQVVAGANKKYWWKCDVASHHEWDASPNKRTSGRGCPYCTLTPRSAQEIRLAHELSALIDFDVEAHKVRFDGRVRDVDILINDLSVVIEFDGAYWHRNSAEKDFDKTKRLEAGGWNVIRVREKPLDSIHKNDVMVPTEAPAKQVADLVLQKIIKVTGVKIPKLREYLASDEPWREKEALVAIREYQAENARKKAERDAKRKAKKKS